MHGKESTDETSFTIKPDNTGLSFTDSVLKASSTIRMVIIQNALFNLQIFLDLFFPNLYGYYWGVLARFHSRYFSTKGAKTSNLVFWLI